MSTKEINEYYDSTENRVVREDLIYALSLVGEERIAIDCGCGAGSDIAFLRSKGFEVYAFDVEEESINRCQARFKGDERVHLSNDDFSSFTYPDVSLVVADASLFFCPPNQFNDVWSKISFSLISSSGVFCGSFLGPNDTMASAEYDKEAFWPEVSIFTEDKLRAIFADFKIERWQEHQISGQTAQGVDHNWHIFSVIAKKI